jgi:two-component system chemotaxis response regulator CheY
MPEIVYENIGVLVVEDQDFVRELVANMMRQIGFRQVATATDGAAALKAVGQEPPRLILCDINMEPMNGIDFVQHLQKAGFSGPNRIPTIFLTAHAEEALVKKAITMGIDAFLVKPVKRQTLQQKIDAVLARAGITR